MSGRNFWVTLDLIRDVDARMRAVEAMHREGEISDFQLWEVLSNHRSPFSPRHGRMVYENLGFAPFAGFPLTRAGRVSGRRAAFDAVEGD